MKLKMKYSKEPWYYVKNFITSKGFNIAEVFKTEGGADEKNDNLLLMTASPDLLKACLAEHAYSSLDCEEGDAILESFGYVTGSKCEFVRSLRISALKKVGVI